MANHVLFQLYELCKLIESAEYFRKRSIHHHIFNRLFSFPGLRAILYDILVANFLYAVFEYGISFFWKHREFSSKILSSLSPFYKMHKHSNVN